MRTGRTPRGFWIGRLHVGVNRWTDGKCYRERDDGTLEQLGWRYFKVLWCETDFPHGNGTGKTLRFTTRWGYLRLQFGGPRPWAMS